MSKNLLPEQPTYDVVNPKTGLLRSYPLAKQPRVAGVRRLDENGGEVHCGEVLVNPLNRQPSIKSMVQAAERSGALLRMHRSAQNLKLAEDGDPAFEGYSRQWLEENYWTQPELDMLAENMAPPEAPEAPEAPSSPPATTPPPTPDDPLPASPEPKA